MSAESKRPRPRRGRVWTEADIREALAAFLGQRTTWPTYREFTAAGARGLRDAIARVGGAEYWAVEMGLVDTPRPQGGVVKWTDEAIAAALSEMLAGRDRWPTRTEFADAGLRGLAEVLRARGDAPHWASRLGVAPPRRIDATKRKAPPSASASASTGRPWPFWTEPTIASALQQFLAGREEWPRYCEFVRTGRQSLYQAVRVHGGSRLWAQRMGVRWVQRRGGGGQPEWNEDRVRDELRTFLADRSVWPSAAEFKEAGRASLLRAARRCGGTERWRREFSLPQVVQRPERAARHHRSAAAPGRHSRARPHWTDQRIEAAIAPLVERLGRWPTKGEFRQAGLSRALTAVYDHGGSARWQRHFGVTPREGSAPVPDRTRWTEERIAAELLAIIAHTGRWPTERELREHIPPGLYSAVVRHGGVRKWRRRLSNRASAPVAL